MEELMANMDNKVSQVSSAQEKEFLNAYRVHMLNVQLELRELKQKVEKAEASLKDDGEVAKLEDECNWFRGETERLQSNRTTMLKDIKYMRSRLRSLEDQQVFLRDQLKTVLKKTRVLEAEIQFHGGSLIQSVASMGAEDDAGGVEFPSPDKLPEINDGNTRRVSPSKSRRLLKKSKSGTDEIVDGFVSQSAGRTYQRGEVIKMRASKSKPRLNKSPPPAEEQTRAIQESRTQLELLLEELIRQKFAEIVQRRSLTVASNSKSRLRNALSSTREGIQELTSQISYDKLPREIEGMTGLGTEHFTNIDRFSTMVDMLSRYEVFEDVVQKIIEIRRREL